MTKVYIAAAAVEIPRARAAMKALKEAGFALTYDWTEEVEAAMKSRTPEWELPVGLANKYASTDLRAIEDADALWLLAPEKGGRGSWVEFGFATALKKIRVVSGWACRGSIFTATADYLVETDAKGLQALVQRFGEQP